MDTKKDMMGRLVNFATPLHRRAQRNYLERMVNDKVSCMHKAKEYEYDYWDGDRCYGYGGYKYDGRWKVVAEAMIKYYNLTEGSSILDIGCGKGHLLYEFNKLLPGAQLVGIDISAHGISNAPEEIRSFLINARAQDPLPYGNNQFDLVISLGCLHNLRIFELDASINEIERVGKEKYIMLESYRNEQELFNLQCWALTCESFFASGEWVWLFNHFRYNGDYEFIYFE